MIIIMGDSEDDGAEQHANVVIGCEYRRVLFPCRGESDKCGKVRRQVSKARMVLRKRICRSGEPAILCGIDLQPM